MWAKTGGELVFDPTGGEFVFDPTGGEFVFDPGRTTSETPGIGGSGRGIR